MDKHEENVRFNIELKGIASEILKMQFCTISELNKMLSSIGYEVKKKPQNSEKQPS